MKNEILSLYINRIETQNGQKLQSRSFCPFLCDGNYDEMVGD